MVEDSFNLPTGSKEKAGKSPANLTFLEDIFLTV